MSGELAASVIHAELGAEPHELFAQWDGVPIAAASVGQVHRALTHDDRAVAVKVQYPGAEEALQGDLDNAGGFLALLAKRGDVPAQEVDLGPMLAEIRARITEESDYRLEAANQQRFADFFAGHPTIRVPGVLPELSGGRVLTTELYDGVRFAETAGWDQHARDLAGETVFRFVFDSVFRMGAYNGDPHPGNYLFGPDGEVCFLDFGLCRTVEPEVTRALGQLFEQAVVDDDAAAFRTTLEKLEFLKPDAPVSDQLVFEKVALPWKTLLSTEPAPMPLPITNLVPTDEQEKALAAAFTLPPTFLLLTTRTLIGMQALISRLGAQHAWLPIAREIWPFTADAPSTPLGEREQAWRQALHAPA